MRGYGVIYGLFDATGLRYIGQTTRPLADRLADHCTPSQNKDRDHRSCWMRKLLTEGLRPCIEQLAVAMDRAQLNKLEMAYIKTALIAGHRLVNTTAGGEGCLRGPLSAEMKARLSAAQKGKKRGPHSAEQRARMSKAALGKPKGPMSDDHKAKLSAATKGRSKSAETRERMKKAQIRLAAERRDSGQIWVSEASEKAFRANHVVGRVMQ